MQRGTLFSSSPGASATTTGNGRLHLTWVFPTLKGPSNAAIKVTLKVDPSVANGTNLNFSAAGHADDGRSDSESSTVQVRNR